MIKASLCILLVLSLIQHVRFLVAILRNYDLITTTRTDLHPRPKNRILVAIAVLDEPEELLRSCCEFFYSIRDKLHEVAIITTHRDTSSTPRVAVGIANCYPPGFFRVVEAENSDGNKGAQLNAFVSQTSFEDHDLIAIYDIDSRPDPPVFDYLSRLQKPMEVYQQYAIYDTNLDRLNWLCKAGALHQSAWSLGFEARFALGLRDSSLMKYLVGHGLVIRGDVFRRLGAFEPKAMAEDLIFGYKLSAHGVRFNTLPHFEHSDFATTPLISVWQSSRWFAGELELIKYAPSGRWFKALRMLQLAAWPLEPILVMFCIFLCCAGIVHPLPLTLLLGAIMAESLATNSKVHFYAPGSWSALLFPAAYCLWFFVKPLGPLHAIVSMVFCNSYIPYKTEKSSF